MALTDGRAPKRPISSGSSQEINQDGKTKRVHKVQNSNEGRFSSTLRLGMQILYNQGNYTWVDGYINRIWHDKTEFGERPCKFVMWIILTQEGDYDEAIDFPSYGSNLSERSPLSYEIRAYIKDPVLEQLDGSQIYLYKAIKSIMPQNMKREWTEKVQSDDMKSFNFELLFQHLSKDGTKHSFDNIISSIGRDEKGIVTRSTIDEAANKEGAYKEILNVIAYMMGIFVAVEIDYLNGDNRTSSLSS